MILLTIAGYSSLGRYEPRLLRVPAERLLGRPHAQGAEPQVLQAALRPYLQAGNLLEAMRANPSV